MARIPKFSHRFTWVSGRVPVPAEYLPDSRVQPAADRPPAPLNGPSDVRGLTQHWHRRRRLTDKRPWDGLCTTSRLRKGRWLRRSTASPAPGCRRSGHAKERRCVGVLQGPPPTSCAQTCPPLQGTSCVARLDSPNQPISANQALIHPRHYGGRRPAVRCACRKVSKSGDRRSAGPRPGGRHRGRPECVGAPATAAADGPSRPGPATSCRGRGHPSRP